MTAESRESRVESRDRQIQEFFSFFTILPLWIKSYYMEVSILTHPSSIFYEYYSIDYCISFPIKTISQMSRSSHQTKGCIREQAIHS